MNNFTAYTEDGKFDTDDFDEIYHLKFHRLDGPALIARSNGRIKKESYWINGVLCKTKKQFEKRLMIYKMNLL